MDQAEEMVDDEMLVMEVEGVLVIGYVGGVTHKSTFESSCHCFWRGILVPAVEVAVVVHKLLSLFACSWVVVPLWLFCLLELGRAGGLGTLRVRSCHDISLSLSLSFFLVLDCSVWKCVCVLEFGSVCRGTWPLSPVLPVLFAIESNSGELLSGSFTSLLGIVSCRRVHVILLLFVPFVSMCRESLWVVPAPSTSSSGRPFALTGYPPRGTMYYVHCLIHHAGWAHSEDASESRVIVYDMSLSTVPNQNCGCPQKPPPLSSL